MTNVIFPRDSNFVRHFEFIAPLFEKRLENYRAIAARGFDIGSHGFHKELSR